MKTSIKSIAAAVALTAFAAAPASAMVLKGDLSRDINSAISSSSNITASVQGDTVIFSGYFTDAIDMQKAIQTAKNSPGVNRVINNAFRSN